MSGPERARVQTSMPRKAQNNKRDLKRVAHERFGYDSLKPGQEEAIRPIPDGRDTLLVMPTGAGKSAVYQITGQLFDRGVKASFYHGGTKTSELDPWRSMSSSGVVY